MLSKLLEKWTCKHKWKVHADIDVTYADDYGVRRTQERRQTLICTDCGEIKKITL